MTSRDGATRGRPAGSGLSALKPAFVARLRRLEDHAVARSVSADALTWAAVGVAGLTALVVVAGTRVPLLWLAVAPLALLRMACNAMDGSLARRTSSETRRGAVLNELGDRVADALTFGALAAVVGAPLALGVLAVALATSFVAVLGQACAGERLAAGPLGKPDRVAVLSVSAAVAAFAGPAAITVGAWTIVALGGLTVVRRARLLWRAVAP